MPRVAASRVLGLANDDQAGTVVFVKYHVAPIQAGQYEVRVEQRVTHEGVSKPDAPDYVNEASRVTKRFAVLGPRFALAADDIHALFPPPNNRGPYHDCVAHVTLNGRTIPWLRSPGAGQAPLPWLAVLLFHESDPPPPVKTIEISELDAGAPPGTVSYGEAYRSSTDIKFEPEFDGGFTDRCRAIDIPIALFNAIAPCAEDLPWLTHARTVTTDAKPGTPPSDYAVVVGNRLARRNTVCTAHLVSLEQMLRFLPSGSPRRPSAELARRPKTTCVRLVSLASWSFTSVDPAESFAGYLENVNVEQPFARPYAGPRPAAGTPEATIANAFAMGYTAAPHQTRLGDRTGSWYRGPFLPFKPSGRHGLPDTGVKGADTLLRYDPSTQMFDVSYAAAWQIGRLLALQDQHFSTALRAWRRSNTLAAACEAEREQVRDVLADVLGTEIPPALLHAPAGDRAVTRASMRAAALAAGRAAAALKGPVHFGRPRRALFKRRRALAALRDTTRKFHALSTAPPAVPADITAWLARLSLLHDVPLSYLVPDETMLPVEAIRFFYLDPRWTEALADGAFSIGRSTSADHAHDRAVAAHVHRLAKASARQLRASRAPGAANDGAITGFLLRSAVVAGWPGLEAYAYGANNQDLPAVLRFERLAPNLLLFMVEGEIHHVAIREPAEGLHFGADFEHDDKVWKALRYITVPATKPTEKPGSQIEDVEAAVPLDGNRVLDMPGLVTSIRTTLLAAHAIADGDKNFTAAELALELVHGVQEVIFDRA